LDSYKEALAIRNVLFGEQDGKVVRWNPASLPGNESSVRRKRSF
jgi:hypothetical protein